MKLRYKIAVGIMALAPAAALAQNFVPIELSADEFQLIFNTVAQRDAVLNLLTTKEHEALQRLARKAASTQPAGAQSTPAPAGTGQAPPAADGPAAKDTPAPVVQSTPETAAPGAAQAPAAAGTPAAPQKGGDPAPAPSPGP